MKDFTLLLQLDFVVNLFEPLGDYIGSLPLPGEFVHTVG